MKSRSIAVRIPGSEERLVPIAFDDVGFERVVAVGSDPDCNVRLIAPGVAPLHAFLAAVSNHLFVEYIHPEDGHEAYATSRIDHREFPIGPFRLRFVSTFPKTPPVVVANRRSRWTDLLDRILVLPPLEDPEVAHPVQQALAPFPDEWLARGALEPRMHPRGAMGRSQPVEIGLSDFFRAELEAQSRRAGQSPSAYASSCLEIEVRQPSARARRSAAEHGHGSHRYVLFASRRLLERLQRDQEEPRPIEEVASRIVATRLVRRAQG